MKASALLILLLFPSLALGQQQYFGRMATSVQLPPPADPADFAKLTIHDNDVITEENIRSSIQALYATGHYRKIEADVTEMGPDVVVTFIVTAQYYFSTFRLEPDDVLPRPITSYFQPPLGKKYSGAVVERLKADTKALFAENGFFDVEIGEKTDFNESNHLTTVVLKATVQKERAKIHSILFTGEQNIIPINELQRELKISKDDDFDTDKIDKATVRIRKKFVDKGYLTAKVSIERKYVEDINGVDLTVDIDPGKATRILVIDGTDSKSLISDEELRTMVPVYQEGTVDEELVEEGAANIRAYYRQKGYFEAKVVPKTVTEADQSITIQYSVIKGEKHRVRAIRIVGNSFFSEKEILQSMKNRQGKLDSGLFSDELLKTDVTAIQALYRDAGFQHTTVSAEPLETNHEIELVITIHEGLRSVLGNIIFTGNQTFTEPQLWTEAGIQSDQVYSAAIINNARGALGAFYFKNGFSEVRIESHTDTVPDYDIINVTFDIVEGPRYKVGLILVAGNVRTAKTIVTRAIDIQPGDPYNPQLILESQQKLYGLGIFDRVDIVPIDQDSGNLKNLLIQVEESKTLLVTPGIGVTTLLGTVTGNTSIGVNNPVTGTTPGPRATLEISKINLRGLNQTLAVRLRAGYRQAQFQASYRNPRVFRLHNVDYLGVLAVSFDKTHYPTYDSSDVNISLQLIRKLNKSDTLLLSPNYDTVNLQNIRVNPNLSRFPNETGVIQIARLDTTFIRDRRTNPKKPAYAAVDPSSGIFSTSDFQVANKLLGSEVNFIALYNQTNYYFPVQEGKVLATSARVGWKHPYAGDLLLPISERFFAGGSSTLRGFALDDAGPPGGGQVLLIGNLEYRFPLKKLPIRNFYGALFYDTGNVFETPADVSLRKFSQTIGFGLRYMTPLGPIRIDVGDNLMPRPQDRKYHVFFSLGYPF